MSEQIAEQPTKAESLRPIVLIVDHQKDFCKRLATRMRLHDPTVLLAIATSLKTAHEVARAYRDRLFVIVTDIMVEGEPGSYVSTLPWIKTLKSSGQVRAIIAATCAHNEQLMEAGATEAVQDFPTLHLQILDRFHAVHSAV